MINEAVILAGGLGTRLRGVVSDVPKPLAPIGGRPFLSYLLKYLDEHHIERAVIASGFRHESIERALGYNYGKMRLVYSSEEEPLGTGGAVLKAADKTEGREFLILNGDTFFDVDLQEFEKSHISDQAPVSVAVKHMDDTSRYGSVVIKNGNITAFKEKGIKGSGYINGGVYIVNKMWFAASAPAKKFSFEKEILEKMAGVVNLAAFQSEGYFIDIGIPDDYLKACSDLPAML